MGETDADMAAFGASDAACYKWPDDTPEHRALRAAYMEGAADAARGRPDDSEPVSEAWARAVAPSGVVGNGRVTLTVRPWALRINALTVSDRPTRGQVRAACRLFHVELKEPEAQA